jgi:hypothetical protein
MTPRAARCLMQAGHTKRVTREPRRDLRQIEHHFRARANPCTVRIIAVFLLQRRL